MKKQILLALMLFASAGIAQAEDESCCSTCVVVCEPVSCCECKVNSRTFFSVQPLFQIATPEFESVFRDRMHARTDGHGGAIQIVPFGSRSTESNRLASFFTPFCKSSLEVSEQLEDTPDVLAQYFNIRTVNGTFKSKIKFCPTRTEAGVGLSYKQSFYERSNGSSFWFLITAPITYVHTDMGFCEQVIDDGGGVNTNCTINLSGGKLKGTRQVVDCDDCCSTTCCDTEPITASVANMTEAFRQKEWCCGKIDCRCDMTETRLANFDILIGYETVRNDEYYLESFFGITAPTGNRVKGIRA